MYDLENVPMPATGRKWMERGRIAATLSVMKIGQSFVPPGCSLSFVRTSIKRFHDENAQRFTVRVLDNGAVRVWRVK
jgi:hypothetical protein